MRAKRCANCKCKKFVWKDVDSVVYYKDRTIEQWPFCVDCGNEVDDRMFWGLIEEYLISKICPKCYGTGRTK